MGKFYEKIMQKYNSIMAEKNAPAPDFMTDSIDTVNYFKRSNALNYQLKQLSGSIKGALKKLSPEKRRQFYDSCKNENSMADFTFERFNNSIESNLEADYILRDNLFRVGADNAIRNLENAMDPEQIDEAANEVGELTDPSQQNYPLESKVRRPYEGRINELKNGIPADDPEADRKRVILDRAAENLVYMQNDYLEYVDKLDTGAVKGTITGMQTASANIEDVNAIRYFEKFENGSLLNKMPRTETRRHQMGRIDPSDTKPGGDLTEQDIETLKNAKPAFSEKLKQDVISMANAFDQMGEEKFRNQWSYSASKGKYTGEQGLKLYGFWPLSYAKKTLAEAVKQGDISKIDAANREFERIKGLTDENMKTASHGYGGYHPGNINSTRPENFDNPLPVEYVDNWTDHNRVNGVYCLWALSKNTGKSVAEILEDPSKAINDIGEKYVKDNGFEPENMTDGAKLFNALGSKKYNDYCFYWGQENALFSKGMAGVASVADNPNDREEALGICSAGLASASYNVNYEKKLWNDLRTDDVQKREMISAYSVLTPKEEFSLHDLAKKLGDPDKLRELTPEAQVEKLRQEGKLDFKKIAERGQQLIDEAKAEEERLTVDGLKPQSNYTPEDEMLRQSVVMKKVLNCATAEERQTEGFRKLAETAVRMNNRGWRAKLQSDPEALNTAINALENNLDLQNGPKKGWFLSSTNSAEHQTMVKAQTLLYYKLKSLRGDPWPEDMPENMKKQVLVTSVESATVRARNATYNYSRIKTNNGKDDSFWHDVGAQRYNSSINSLLAIDNFGCDFGVISPAETEINRTRNDIYSHSRNSEWLRNNFETYAAKLLFASMVDHKDLPPAVQSDLVKNNAKINQIKESPMFRKMMQMYSQSDLLDAAIKGGGALTDKLISAQYALDPHREGVKKPKDMSAEEKHDFIKNSAPALQ